MGKISILDCTLRDGGYINDWDFGFDSIKGIINKLSNANLDIIECGFIEDVEQNMNKSVFNSIKAVIDFIQPKKSNVMYVGMIAYPYIPIEKISDRNEKSIDGIRVTFHEHEIEEATVYSKQLMEKGYEVFFQPVGTTSYSDKKLLALIEIVNEIKPFAFYLVDTLGVMYKNDLLRMFHLLDNNMDASVAVGFHSHNNLQLSFSNAQELLTLNTKREIIIDSSVFGMGRGAGNLCTELITQYINENLGQRYDVIPILEIYDEYLGKLHDNVMWGYSVPYFLAAINKCHPNYASYLLSKQTLTVKSINKILKNLPLESRDLYNLELIEDEYTIFQKNSIDDSDIIKALKNQFKEIDKVLVIGPGSSVKNEIIKIEQFISNENPYIISVNFNPENIAVNKIFISNAKRFNDFFSKHANTDIIEKVIVTSNIKLETEALMQVNYSDLLVHSNLITDNAGLMLINLLKKLDVKKVYIAGMDGYANNTFGNFLSDVLNINMYTSDFNEKNQVIKSELELLKNSLDIEFITSSIYN